MPRPAVVKASPGPSPAADATRQTRGTPNDQAHEAWSASADRVLPPRAAGMPARSMVPMVAGGAAAAVIAGLLVWFVQRPAADAPRPVQISGAASAASAASATASMPALPVPVLAEAASQVAASASLAVAPPAVAASSPVPAPVQAVVVASSPAPVVAKIPAAANPRTQAAPNASAQQTPAPGPSGMTVDSAALRPLPPSAPTVATTAHRKEPNGARTAAVVNERRPPVLPGPAPVEAPVQRAPVESPPRAQPTTAERPNDGALTAVPSVGRDPREQCGGRMLLALHKCLVRECVKPQYYDHSECQQVRAIEERARIRSNP
jgi:hypothetical protein